MQPRSMIALAVLSAGLIPFLRAQSNALTSNEPAGRTDSSSTARAIAELEIRLESALARRDRTALESLTDSFSWIHGSDGRIDSRDAWLASAAQGTALTGQRSIRTEHGPTLTTHGTPQPHTAVRIARIRLRDTAGTRKSWLRQTRVFVHGADGKWRLASGQGTLMYEGPPLDAALHARYAGTYAIAPGRALTLTWTDESLFARFPNGAESQIFLASPTEEAVRTTGSGGLRFTLAPDGEPLTAALVRNGQEIWRATRHIPKRE